MILLILTLVVGVRLAVRGRALLIPSNGPARFRRIGLLHLRILRHNYRLATCRLKLQGAASGCRTLIAHEIVNLGLKTLVTLVLLGGIVALMSMHFRILGPGNALLLLGLVG